MKLIIIIISTIFILPFGKSESNFHDFKIQELNSGKQIDFKEFKGKKVLLVNVASKCGYTPQYTDLQKLSTMYGDQLVVLGLPCDQFGGQELDQESLIEEFCSGKYDVTFPMTTVVEVKGENQHPIYNWLTHKSENGVDDYKVSWNFNKFLIDENGSLIAYFPSKVKPFSDEILQYLE